MTITSLNAEPMIAVEQTDDDLANLELVKDMVDHKKHIEFEEDFHAMAVLTMIKSNQQKLLLPAKLIGKQIFNSLMLFFL
jgi:hypothetical protein